MGIKGSAQSKTVIISPFFEPKPDEIWITTTYSGFAGYLAVKFQEKDFAGKK